MVRQVYSCRYGHHISMNFSNWVKLVRNRESEVRILSRRPFIFSHQHFRENSDCRSSSYSSGRSHSGVHDDDRVAVAFGGLSDTVLRQASGQSVANQKGAAKRLPPFDRKQRFDLNHQRPAIGCGCILDCFSISADTRAREAVAGINNGPSPRIALF